MSGFNRRQLFKLRLGDLSREVGRTAREERVEEEGISFVRPPGASEDEEKFLETCERCGACAEACPHDIVRKFGPAAGSLENTPFLEPAAAPCRWCVDMPCISACPSGALQREDGAEVPPIAKVRLDLERCLNTLGTLCDTCSYRCPGDVRAIRMVQHRPVLDLERCTGCGMCAYHCEAEPSAFEMVFLDAEPQ